METWRDTLERNWVYMVAAGLLSLLLWVAVSADAVTQEIMPTDLVVVNGDGRYVLTGREPEIGTAEVLFSGRNADLVALSVSRPRLIVRIDSVGSRVQRIPLRVDMIRDRGGGELTGVRALSVVQPDTLRLRFEPKGQKVVPVRPRIRVSMADGYMVSDSVRVRPGLIGLEGPESVIARIDSLITLPLTGEDVSDTIRVELPVERPDHTGLQLTTSTVEVLVPVERRGERLFTGLTVRIQGDGVDRDTLWLEPGRVDLRVTGPESLLSGLGGTDFEATIDLAELGSTGHAAVRIGGGGPALRLQAEPESVRVERGPEDVDEGA